MARTGTTHQGTAAPARSGASAGASSSWPLVLVLNVASKYSSSSWMPIRKSRVMLAEIGSAAEGARDIDDLNSAPPIHPFFEDLVGRLEEQSVELRGQELEERTLTGCRPRHGCFRSGSMTRSQKTATSGWLNWTPTTAGTTMHWDFLQNPRGHFREGVLANQRAVDLEAEPKEAYE